MPGVPFEHFPAGHRPVLIAQRRTCLYCEQEKHPTVGYPSNLVSICGSCIEAAVQHTKAQESGALPRRMAGRACSLCGGLRKVHFQGPDDGACICGRCAADAEALSKQNPLEG